MLKLLSCIVFFLFAPGIISITNAQVDSTNTATETPKKEKTFKNTISYNITNTMIFGGKAQVFCYERVVGKTQSFTVELGTFSFPQFQLLSGKYRSETESTQKGYKFAFDYRFYLASENKYNAPRGIYFAPYYSYNYFNRKKAFGIDTSSTNVPVEVAVNTDFTFTTHSLGIQLGYQFVFWKRLAIDLILFGPGLTTYKVTAKLDTNLDPADESELFDAINDVIAQKIPGYSYVVKPVDFEKTGSVNTTSVGFRYLVHVGFRF